MLWMLLAGPTPSGWTLVEQDHFCASVARFEKGYMLSLTFDAQKNDIRIVLANPLFQSLRADELYKIDITLTSGKTDLGYLNDVEFKAIDTQAGNERIKAVIAPLELRVLNVIARSSGIAFHHGHTLVASLTLDGSAAAIKELTKCAIRVAKERPQDPFKDDVDPTLAIPTSQEFASQPSDWITSADYPLAARRAGDQGLVRYRLAVSPDGRITSCTVASSSGSSLLDSETCNLISRRGRFSGKKSVVLGEYRWVLPEGGAH